MGVPENGPTSRVGKVAYFQLEDFPMQNFLNTLWQDEGGQDITEYVLLIVLIALGVTGALVIFEGKISDAFGTAGDELDTAVSQ